MRRFICLTRVQLTLHAHAIAVTKFGETRRPCEDDEQPGGYRILRSTSLSNPVCGELPLAKIYLPLVRR